MTGNHEYNAIGYVLPRLDGSGKFLREHSATNMAQHAEFLRQVGEGSRLRYEVLEWFKTLPPTLDLDGARVVHAWWHQPFVDRVAQRLPSGRPMDEAFLRAAYDEDSALYVAMEGLTKGLEVRLPPGHSFFDYGGKEWHEMRTKWWKEDARTFREIAIVGSHQDHRVPKCELPADYLAARERTRAC